MSNIPNSATQSGGDPVLLSQTETDAFLKAVSEQLNLNTFDSNDQQLLKQMIESLGDSRGMVRLDFAEALGAIGEPAVPLLLDALANHPNVVVRRASGKTLTLIADPKAIPILIDALLNDQDTVVQGSAIGALARTGRAAVPALLEVLASPENPESIKGHAAWALSFMGADVKDLLYEEITSDSAEVRCAVVGAIANIAREQPEEQAFKILIHSLTDPAPIVRSEAASTLGKLAYQPALPNLIELLDHPDAESRKAAALALMKLGDRAALEPLQTALTEEPEAAIQTVIKLAISQIERHSEEDD